MFKQTISGATEKLLALLGKSSFFPKKAYLAGGTALALQLGHRISFDLDFYIPKKFNEVSLLKELKKIAPFEETDLAKLTILGNFPNVRFSIFYYEYPLIKPFVKYQNVNIASLEDISAMKIGAVSSRGTKRDFVDLFFLVKHGFSLNQMLVFYNDKYGNFANLYAHILRSLVYFDDADIDERELKMIIPCNWLEVKKYFQKEVPKILDEELRKIK